MWLDRAVKWLLPREEHFFDMLERSSDCAFRSSQYLLECCNANTYQDREKLIEKLRTAEHEADDVIHDIYDALNKTFVTPLDRSDIYSLSTEIENITDCIYSTSMHIIVHAMDDIPKGSLELATKINQACTSIHSAVILLRKLKDFSVIRSHCKQIKELETEGDQVFRKHIGDLFKLEKDAIRLLKHKEFLEGLEKTLDACDDVGNALDTIVIKNA